MTKKYIKPELEIRKLQETDIIKTSGETVEAIEPKTMINSKAAANLGSKEYTDVFK